MITDGRLRLSASDIGFQDLVQLVLVDRGLRILWPAPMCLIVGE
jgi:hypothetical protein